MKKVLKLLLFILFVSISFIAVGVLANKKNKIVDYFQGNRNSAVLYEDNTLYYWAEYDGEYYNKKIDGVKKIVYNRYQDYEILVLDTDNNIRYLDMVYNCENECVNEIVLSEILVTDVKDVDDTHFITNNNELYSYYYEWYNEIKLNKKLIMKDVKEWSYNRNVGSYLLLDTDDVLYAYGQNIFGKKINDGENIVVAPIAIAENVREFSCDINDYYNTNNFGNYYLTNDNELFIISSNIAYPTMVKSDVEKFLFNRYYVQNGNTYEILFSYEDNVLNVKKDELVLEEKIIDVYTEYGTYYWFLTENGNLYYNEEFFIAEDIKEIYADSDNIAYVITNDGTLKKYTYSYEYDDWGDKVDKIDELIILEDVKKYMSNSIITEDEVIYVKGSGEHDIADYNGTKKSNYKNYSIIKGLPNVPENILVSKITLNHLNKKEFSIGEVFDYYYEVYPYNSENKNIVWESSDESIVSVNNNGTIKALKEGVATITVKNEGTEIYDTVEIKVYPKIDTFNIISEDEITVKRSEYYKLNVEILPENVLKQKLIWTLDETDDEYYDDIVSFYNGKYYGSNGNGYINKCNIDDMDSAICAMNYNEITFKFWETGTYTIRVTTKDKLYSDAIKVHVTQGITSFGTEVDPNNYLGQTLYIYMAESKYMDLKVKPYPEDATDKEIIFSSSDESIATVDQNGRVTALKPGKVKIKVKAKNYDVEREYNVLIFGTDITTKIGDVDGDGIVDILDVVKLRKHVAGVEALQ